MNCAAGLNEKNWKQQLVAPTDEEIYQKRNQSYLRLLQESRAEARLQRDSFAAIIEDINVRIHALEASLVSVRNAPATSETDAGFSGVSSLVEGDFTVKQAPPSAAYLGYWILGWGLACFTAMMNKICNL